MLCCGSHCIHVQESHASPVHTLAVNHVSPELGNLFATVGADQATGELPWQALPAAAARTRCMQLCVCTQHAGMHECIPTHTPTHAYACAHHHHHCATATATREALVPAVYDGEHMGGHVAVVVHFTNTASEHAAGGGLQAAAWLSAAGWSEAPAGDACLAVAGADACISGEFAPGWVGPGTACLQPVVAFAPRQRGPWTQPCGARCLQTSAQQCASARMPLALFARKTLHCSTAAFPLRRPFVAPPLSTTVKAPHITLSTHDLAARARSDQRC